MTTGEQRSADAPGLTIEQLAARSHLSVRNIRAYRSRGLLPPPRRVGRRGYYGEEHVGRLERVRRLQEAGFNLAAISALVNDETVDAESGRREALTPWLAEEPLEVDGAELRARFGTPDHAAAQAEELGLITALPGDRFLVHSPLVLDVSTRLAQLGVGRSALLDIHARVAEATRGLAACFVELCLNHAWEPFANAPDRRERWDEVRERARRFQPLAGKVLLASFALQMRRAAAAVLAADEPIAGDAVSRLLRRERR